jgi:hypothetical protein
MMPAFREVAASLVDLGRRLRFAVPRILVWMALASVVILVALPIILALFAIEDIDRAGVAARALHRWGQDESTWAHHLRAWIMTPYPEAP